MATREEIPIGCPLCLNAYDEPRRLICGDCFCTDCLIDYVRKNVRNGEFGCPVCKKTFQAPDEVSFNKQFRAMFPIETDFIEKSNKQPSVKANIQSDVPKCEKPGHKSALFRYCTEHKECICAVCEKSSHLKCHVIDVSDTERTAQSGILEILQKLEMDENAIDSEYKNSESALKSCRTDLRRMRESLKTHTEKIVNNIHEEEKTLTDKISVVENEVEGKLTEIEAMQKQVQEAKREVYDAQSEKNKWAALQKVDRLKQTYNYILHIPSATWTCDIKFEQQAIKVGYFEVNKKQSIEGGKYSRHNRGTTPGNLKYIKMKVSINFICGIVEIKEHLLIVHGADPHIYGYKKTGEYDKKVKVAELEGPDKYGSIAHIPDDSNPNPRVCIIDRAREAMHLVELSCQLEIKHHTIVKLGFKPACLSVSDLPYGEIIVSRFGSFRATIYNFKGKELYTVNNVHEGVGHVLGLRDGSFVGTHNCSNKITWTDRQGRTLRTYDDHQHPMKFPCFLAQDCDDNILVAYHHGVMLVDDKGVFIKDIVMDGDVQNPWCLHLAEDGCLYIADYSNDERKLKVISYGEGTRQYKVDKTMINTTLTLFTNKSE